MVSSSTINVPLEEALGMEALERSDGGPSSTALNANSLAANFDPSNPDSVIVASRLADSQVPDGP